MRRKIDWKPRLKKLGAALFAATAIFAITATSASAAQSNCPSGGYYCVWNEANWAYSPDYYWTIPSAGTGGFCVNYLNNLADNVDSVKITGSTALSVTQYSNLNCSGTTVWFGRPDFYGGPSAGQCAVSSAAWACFVDGAGSYKPSSAWIIKS